MSPVHRPLASKTIIAWQLRQRPELVERAVFPSHYFDLSAAAPPAGGWREDTGIANAKEWGISLPKDGEEPVNESGINEDGSTWFKETGEDLGENGYTCKWTLMGGRSEDGLSEWKETVSRRCREDISHFRAVSVTQRCCVPWPTTAP